MPMLSVLRMPKVQISILLVLLFVLVAPRIGIQLSLYLLLFSVGFCVLSDLLFAFLRKKTFFIPYAAIVTGLILALIIDTDVSWYHILVASTVAMALKNFLRISGRHVLNPAASGLVVLYLLFGIQPSWWAPTLYLGGFSSPLNIAIFAVIVAFAYVSVKRMKRGFAVVSYLITTSLLALISSSAVSLNVFLSTYISPGVLFYALLMLAEPMTSPVLRNRQILYGVFVSVMTFVLVQFVLRHPLVDGNFPDVTLVALLLGNILFFKFR